MRTQSRRALLGLLAVGALVLLLGRWIAGLYADRAFFEALDLGPIWQSKVVATSALASGAFACAALFAFLNLYAVRQSIVSLVLPRQVGDLEIPEAVPTERLTFVAIGLALLVGGFFALLPHNWSAALLAWDRVPFREFDPYLEHDLGFYVAWVPFERALQERSTAVMVSVSVMVALAYGATPSIRWSATGLYVSAWVRRHLAVLAGCFVLLVGWDWRLDRYERLSRGSGIWMDTATDALFTAYDHRIALPYLAIASFAALPIAAVLMWAGWRGYLRLAVTMLSLLVLGGPIASALLPLVARGPLSTPEARLRERPYLNTAALFTRRAFAVDEIAGADTTALLMADRSSLSANVSAWDPSALAAVISADPRGGMPAGVAWRATGRGLEAVLLRRPATDGPSALQWNADAVAAGRSDDAGRPYFSAEISRAHLQGVLASPDAGRAVVVADSMGRIAAPAFSTTLARVALAWDLQDPRLLFREAPGPRPRLVTHRDVRARVRHVVPFLVAGPTITPMVRGDSLYWFVELFAVAEYYPLSEAVTADGDAVHYAKHAATAVVQAQTGRVMLIATERPDPVMQRWMRRFPSVFTPIEGAPEWVRAERPPALDVMVVQGSALARVGFQGDSLGRRRLARPDDADADVDEGPATPFQFGNDSSLGWALPMDIPWAGRTLGVLVARGGAGRRTEYHRAPGPRWTSVLEGLQRAADSAGFGRALPDMRRGRVQAIPTAAGPIWVQSYYAWPADGAPRLAGVVVTTSERTVAGRTLSEALGERVLPSAAIAPDAFRERVATLYEAMLAAQRVGDWRAYGEAWSALGRLLDRP